MINLTDVQISAAKANDLTAISDVIRETEPRVLQIANRYATTGGKLNQDLAEELAQEGRIAVWECLESFTGNTVAEFFTFMNLTVEGKLSNARKVEQRQGVSRSAAADFESLIPLAGGDQYEAERLACAPNSPLGKRRMSKDMARACRMAWEGMEYLDRPFFGQDPENPGERGASSAKSADGQLYRASLVESPFGNPGEEELTSDEVTRAHREGTRQAVRRTLCKMPPSQARVLRADYGIGDSAYYGDEVGAADAEMAADFGTSVNAIWVARSKGLKTFPKLYAAGELGAVAGA